MPEQTQFKKKRWLRVPTNRDLKDFFYTYGLLVGIVCIVGLFLPMLMRTFTPLKACTLNDLKAGDTVKVNDDFRTLSIEPRYYSSLGEIEIYLK